MSEKKRSAGISTEHFRYHLFNLDDGQVHFPYEIEANAIQFISQGDAEKALKCFTHLTNGTFSVKNAGTFANSPRKQAEYSAVIAISMICRAAIAGGLDPMVAYDRNDLYLIMVSEADAEAEYWKIILEALYDLCSLVRESQGRNIQSLHIKRCRQYIYQHINQRLTVKDIAAALDLNVSYLSSLFREHEGITLKDYIADEKLKAAEHMLRTSNADICEISEILAFSSPSHLCERFKRHYGMTPKAYRNRYYPVDYRIENREKTVKE